MEEKRLIDANDVYSLFDKSGFARLHVADIDTIPRVDAVEVVRCLDCKHLVLTAEGEHNPCDCVCDYWLTDGLNDNDFCSNGERKDGDGNG